MQAAVALLLLVQLSCDDGNSKPQDTAPDGAVADVQDDGSGVLDAPVEEVGIAYAAEPYGTVAESTIADLGFYDPGTKETVFLHQWYQDPKVKLLMIISTAAW